MLLQSEKSENYFFTISLPKIFPLPEYSKIKTQTIKSNTKHLILLIINQIIRLSIIYLIF